MTIRTLASALIFIAIYFSCSEENGDIPTPFSSSEKMSTEAVEDQVTSIEMALNSFQADPNVIWKNLEWEMGDLTGETEAAYKNEQIIYLKQKSFSSYGATLQEYYISADRLLYMHEYRVNMNCHEGNMICVNETKHYFSKNRLINGLERRTRIPFTQLDRYEQPFLESAMDEVPFISITTDNDAVYQSDLEKFARVRNQWEDSLN